MVYCTLDDKVAYPSSSDKIKVTYENPFIKDSGSYTYDVTFPMSIAKNREIFANAQRLDVKKSIAPFEECRIYVDNRLVMSGKGTVTSITNEKVKVQIAGGQSRIKYNSKFEKHYIDEISFPAVELDKGINVAKCQEKNGKSTWPLNAKTSVIFADLSQSNYVGQKDVCALCPTTDESNSIMANRFYNLRISEKKTFGGIYVDGNYSIILNPAPQPFLCYVLKKVLESEGYTIKNNEIDKDPWNRLVIVSACKTCRIQDALPHWTVYKFLDEVRKLFNASFIFDEVAKTVDILTTNEMLSQNTVTYDCEDEFSSEYDEDGLDNLATSNIEYGFDSSANRQWQDYIPANVLKKYEPKVYSSKSTLIDAASKMTEKERKTTLFKIQEDYLIYAEIPKTMADDSETEEKLVECGYFNPIVRDKDSDDFQDLNICPAAIYERMAYTEEDKKECRWNGYDDAARKLHFVVASVQNEKEAGFEDMEVDDDGEYYTTIQNEIENGEDSDSSSEEEADDKMPVAFISRRVVNLKDRKNIRPANTYQGEDLTFRVPALYTDFRYYNAYNGEISGSLSLESVPAYHALIWGSPAGGKRTFGNLGGSSENDNVEESRFKAVAIDKNNLITIKFITDDIPDPSKIYIFRNKRYICSKVEINVTNDGIEREKTGYFYELL